MIVRVDVGDLHDLEDFADRLERAADELPDRLADALRAEAPAALAAVRAAWLGIEVSSSRGGGESSGLRARAAAATSAEDLPDGVSFTVDGAAVDPAHPHLVRRLNATGGPWVHPVHGTTAMATQQGQEIFAPTLTGWAPQWEASLDAPIDRTLRDIEG